MANALLRGERMGVVSTQQVAFFHSQISEMRIEMDREHPKTSCGSVIALAQKYCLKAFDASYLELALRTGRTLATFDSKLACATRQAGGPVFGDGA
jgi:predicted nucleic acid-binding protein